MHKTKISDRHQSDQKKRSERKKYLNVIYFIDSKRTRTLKFSIGASYLTVGALTLAVVWSLVATGLLVRDRFVIADMSDHSKSLLDSIFAYQTRYDEVYEKAYPDTQVNSDDTIAEESAPEKEKSLLASGKDKKSLTASADLQPTKTVLPVDKTALAKDKSANEKAVDGVPIAIDNFASTILGRNLTIRLSLKNLISPTKSAGSISGVAKFVDASNQTHILQGRPTRSNDEDEHFNIRYFKNKNLVFEAPKDLAGKFAEVTVTIKDDQGNSKDFPYAVNKDVPAGLQTPPPQKVPSSPVATRTPEATPAPAVKVQDETPSEEHSDAIDTSVTSGATEMTNDSSN